MVIVQNRYFGLAVIIASTFCQFSGVFIGTSINLLLCSRCPYKSCQCYVSPSCCCISHQSNSQLLDVDISLLACLFTSNPHLLLLGHAFTNFDIIGE